MPDKTTARDIMRTKVVTVTPDMSVMAVSELLLKNEFSGAPVLSSEGELVGIVSELDCVMHLSDAAMNGIPPRQVGDVMTREVVTVKADATLLMLVDLFAKCRFRRVPVVHQDGHLLGQISRRDLMAALYDKMKVERKREDGPLYLSAVTDRAPASVMGGRRKKR